jgi:hypothetical protein
MHVAAVLPPYTRAIAVMVAATDYELRESLRDNYDQGGVYDENGDIVADLEGDGYLVTIEQAN